MSDDLPARLVRRTALLQLLEERPRTTAELEAALELSRSSVHRTTTAFREAGLVRKEGTEFALTGFGRVAAAEATTYRDRYEAARRLRTFLNVVDADVDLPLAAFADATVREPEPKRAHALTKHVVDRVRSTESVRLFSGVASPFYLDALTRAVRDGMEVEAVFDRRVVEIVFAEHRSEIREAARTGRLTVLVNDGCPFELFVFDDVVGLAAHDDDGIQRAYVETADPDAREWATALYDRYRDEATHATVF